MIFKLVRKFEVRPDVSVKKKSYYFKVYLNEEYQFPNKQEVLHSYTYEHQRLGSAATNTSLSRVGLTYNRGIRSCWTKNSI